MLDYLEFLRAHDRAAPDLSSIHRPTTDKSFGGVRLRCTLATASKGNVCNDSYRTVKMSGPCD